MQRILTSLIETLGFEPL